MKHQGVVETLATLATGAATSADPPMDVIVRHGGDWIEQTTATFSRDEAYRYVLTRQWGDGPLLTWIMLNPSTATQDVLDATVTRCRTRASKAGYDGIVILNLMAVRATDPSALRDFEDPVGPLNDQILATVTTGDVVCAWGTHPASRERGKDVIDVLRGLGDVRLLCLGVTKDGHPRHPLYVPMSQGFEPLP